MRYVSLTAIAVLTLLLAAPNAAAQGRSQDGDDQDRKERREDRDRRDRDRDREDRDERQREGEWGEDDKYEERRRGNRQRRGKRGRGPKFCRNGEGHPVHGRDWCIEKGFGLGDGRYEDGRYDDNRYEDGRQERDRRYGDYYEYDRRRWKRVSERGVRFQVGFLDRLRDRLDEDGLGEDALRRVLGRDAFHRLRSYQRRIGLRGRLSGRLDEGGILDGERRGRTLRVYAGKEALARFADLNGDERADVVLLRRNRR